MPPFINRPKHAATSSSTTATMEADPAQPQHLITELQVGYRLVGL